VLKKLLLEMPETDMVSLLRPLHCWWAFLVGVRDTARYRPDSKHLKMAQTLIWLGLRRSFRPAT
jgi:hypothetical protein